ncbi:MAG: lipopolysaccharide heptosyltransferase I [Comamonadaceae bacterium CG1_02_60_18]|nr:MAG: lipopolysaccharide heptosyltransferase I [Comamonadaceae bacterium CG1_02_60_18]PIQ51075.1 MAG: lipopolysaccharide heptosyltransferase I [Comamonadaceae bacterium CG12_big_fil_rev_8_21_14_0_65_59_15]
MKILIVKLSSLGDVVHAMAAVQDIRRAYPAAQIDWVVERNFAPLVRRCKGVRRVIGCELRRWRKDMFSRETRQAWSAFKTDLQQDTYDAVIDLQGLSKSALVAWFAQLAPNGQRFAMANATEGSSFEAPTRWVADVQVTLPTHVHAVTRARLLCAKALGYTVPHELSFGLLAQKNQALPDMKNVALRTGLKGVVALVHGTSRADKSWPLRHWRTLASRLNEADFGIALPQGSVAEEAFSRDVASGMAHAQLWPRLPLDALIDSMACCAGVIGVDSGLSHIAVALNLPHVQIYNFDTAWRTGPLTEVSAPTGVRSGPGQSHLVSVFAQPTPTVEAVWQAWQGCQLAPASGFGPND